MTKGYVKDFFGNATEMQSWIFDNDIQRQQVILLPYINIAGSNRLRIALWH